MPPTADGIAAGALGIEAKHTWTPPQGIISGGIPDLTLNDQAEFEALLAGGEDAPTYTYLLQSIAGLHGLPDFTDEREARLGRVGEAVYTALATGKTVVYTGTIIGITLRDLRIASNVLRRTFAAMSMEGGTLWHAQKGEGRMLIEPSTAYDTTNHFFAGRCTSLELGDEQTFGPESQPTPWKRAFVLTLRLADPRVYEETINASSANAFGASVFIDNDGSAPTDPDFSVEGDFTGGGQVTLARGTDFVLTFLDLDFSGILWVDFKNRRAFATDISDVYIAEQTAHQDVANSNWWDPGVAGLDPGPNDIGVTSTASTGQWDISWSHANW